MNTIEEKWKDYLDRAVSRDATPEQIAYLRQTFYVGAAGVMEIQSEISNGSMSDEAAWGVMTGLHEEMSIFMDGLTLS